MDVYVLRTFVTNDHTVLLFFRDLVGSRVSDELTEGERQTLELRLVESLPSPVFL